MKIIIAWMPAVLYMTLLSFISNMPGDQIKIPSFPHADKLIHFCAYIILGLLISIRGLIINKLSGVKITSRFLLPALAVGFFHAIGNEIHQIFVPLREFSYWDMAANAAGLVAGFLVYKRLSEKYEVRSEK